jgi:hypothetical protein
MCKLVQGDHRENTNSKKNGKSKAESTNRQLACGSETAPLPLSLTLKRAPKNPAPIEK